MSLKRITQFFNPSSVAVIGASNISTRAGFVVMRNLLQGGFKGPIMPVTPSHSAVHAYLLTLLLLTYQKYPTLLLFVLTKTP